jgi:glycerophosphoryl diester phosphodiesterase
MNPTEPVIFNSKAISHRGRGNGFKDNTIEAFQAAVDAGFQWCEVDLRRTKDGVIVLYHDETINGFPVSELTYHSAEALLEDRGVRLSTLGMFCRSLKNRIKVDFEFKETGFEREALEFILKSFDYDEVLLTSFNPEVLIAVQAIDSNVKTGIIIGEDSFALRPELSNKIWTDFDYVRSLGADIFIAEIGLLDNANIARIVESGLPLYAYTVESLEDYNRFMNDERISGVFTDIIVPD